MSGGGLFLLFLVTVSTSVIGTLLWKILQVLIDLATILTTTTVS